MPTLFPVKINVLCPPRGNKCVLGGKSAFCMFQNFRGLEVIRENLIFNLARKLPCWVETVALAVVASLTNVLCP